VANARPDNFADAFFFSIETLATVGYGEMYPATLYAHVVAATEIACGLAFTAILTGLTFVRFSRPRAKLIFAANPVVAMRNGKPTLMVRIGNGGTAVLGDATAKLNVPLTQRSAEGKVFHRAQEPRLERALIPIFPLFWTLMHVLDERSPLHDYDAARALAADAQVFVLVNRHSNPGDPEVFSGTPRDRAGGVQIHRSAQPTSGMGDAIAALRGENAQLRSAFAALDQRVSGIETMLAAIGKKLDARPAAQPRKSSSRRGKPK